MSEKFTIRVYGILEFENKILVSDEYHKGLMITKFPGGGLQFGEGTVEALIREFMEETGVEVDVRNHLYTTDFFQPSAFDPNVQVVSIYYQVQTNDPGKLVTSSQVFDFNKITDGEQSLRWVRLSELNESDLTFPIDKKVAGLIAGPDQK